MRSSLSSATAILKGFAGWIHRRSEGPLSDFEAPTTSNATPACGRRIPSESDEAEKRWLPGPSLDNFF
jgi:hypothetical protein